MQLCRPYSYALILCFCAVNLAFHLFSHASISGSFAALFAGRALGLALVLLILLRHIRTYPEQGRFLRPLALAVESGMMIHLLVISFRVTDHISMVTAFPYVDGWLVRADLFLGLNWLGYWDWVHATPALHAPLAWAYYKLELATLATLVGLFLIGRADRARMFVECFVICSAIALIFGMLLPARAAVETWIADVSVYSGFDFTPGVYHLTTLDHLRQTTTPVVIGDGPLVGLVTFPSLHTAIGILIVGATIGTLLVWPALIYAALMIAATPVWGGHFFVDLLGGTALAIAVMALWARPLRLAFGWHGIVRSWPPPTRPRVTAD